MIVKNRATGENYPISAATWAKLQSDGTARRYTVVEADTAPEAAVMTQVAEYEIAVKQGTQLQKVGDLDGAWRLFQKAYAIKQTTSLKKRMDELDAELNGVREENALNGVREENAL